MRVPTVWLVYQEFQADTPDIVGIYRARGDAERAAHECRQEARRDHNWVVYGDEDDEGNPIVDWDVDVRVEEHGIHAVSRHRRRGHRGRASNDDGGGSVKRRYNHLYALGFSVDSDDREGATAEEILDALLLRLVELRRTGETLEAVGVPDETIDRHWLGNRHGIAGRLPAR
jgi:hypothetical protein